MSAVSLASHAVPAAPPRATLQGHRGRGRELLSWLAFAFGLALLVVPSVSAWVSLGLVVGAGALPVVRWFQAMLGFDCNLDDLRLTSDDVLQGLDW